MAQRGEYKGNIVDGLDLSEHRNRRVDDLFDKKMFPPTETDRMKSVLRDIASRSAIVRECFSNLPDTPGKVTSI